MKSLQLRWNEKQSLQKMKIRKINWLVVFTVIIFSHLFAVGQDTLSPAFSNEQAQQLYYQALNQKAQGNLPEAVETLQKLLEIDDQNDTAYFELARLNLEQKQLGQAAINAKRATELKPDKDWYWILLADVYKQMKDYKSLNPIFEKLIALKPENKSFYYDQAYAYFLNNEMEKALQAYDQIEQKFGLEDNVLLARQEIYLKQDEPEKAILEIQSLIEQNPEEAKGYIMMANIHLKRGDPKKALKVLDEGHVHIPGDPYISLSKADAYHSRGNEKASGKELKNAFASDRMDLDSKIRLLVSLLSDPREKEMALLTEELAEMLTGIYPNDVRAYALYGDVLVQHNQLQKARQQYLTAVDINPSINTIWEQLLQLELNMGVQEESLLHARQTVALFPDKPIAQFFAGHIFFLNREYKEARNALEAALNYADDNNTPLMGQLYSSLGDTYNALELYNESDQAYTEALALDSSNAATLNNYAYYLSLRKEKLDEAASMSKKSNELEPNNATFQDTYAWVLFQQGNHKEALQWIEKAIANSPETSLALLEHYGDILHKLGNTDKAIEQWKAAWSTGKATGEDVELLSKKIEENTNKNVNR